MSFVGIGMYVYMCFCLCLCDTSPRPAVPAPHTHTHACSHVCSYVCSYMCAASAISGRARARAKVFFPIGVRATSSVPPPSSLFSSLVPPLVFKGGMGGRGRARARATAPGRQECAIARALAGSTLPPPPRRPAGVVRRARARRRLAHAIREFEFVHAPARPRRTAHSIYMSPSAPAGARMYMLYIQAPGVRAAPRTRAGYCLTSPSVYYIYEPQRARSAPHTAPPAASAQPRHINTHTHTHTPALARARPTTSARLRLPL